MRTLVRRTALAVAVLVVAAGCTDDPEDIENPPPTMAETRPAYESIPADPCAGLDLTAPEDLLGELEPRESEGAEEDEITVSGDSHCVARYNDGVNETKLEIRLELLRGAAGDAAEQDPEHEFGYWWAYSDADVEENRDSLPEPEPLPAESGWESSRVLRYTELSDDGLSWDPDGRGLALNGTFTDSNLVGRVLLWREATGDGEAPDPAEHAALVADVADQVLGQVEPPS